MKQDMEDVTMLTRFGKELKKIRIENDEILKDMAAKLNVTAAYLSAVENGNRRVPESWIEIISREYDLEEQEVAKLQDMAFEDRDSIKISFDNQNEAESNLALSFARKFKTLNNADVLEIQKILDRNRG